MDIEIHMKSNEKQENNGGLGSSLIKSISKSGGIDIVSEVSEVALDSIIDNEILKDIPVFGLLAKGFSVFSTIHDRIFLKKVAYFLKGVGEIPEEKKSEFFSEIERDPETTKRVGESMLLLIDRHEDFNKSMLLGKAFSRYIQGNIKYDQFMRVAKAIDGAFIGDLLNLQNHYKSIENYNASSGRPFSDFLNEEISQSLYISGLVSSEGYSESTYCPTDIGEEILKCITS